MTDNREILKGQRSKFEEHARGLRSYLNELKETAAKNGTDEALIDGDLSKASADLAFYEQQACDCADALGHDPAARRTFHVYQDAAGEWRWRLTAGNKRVIAESGEGYHHRHDCLHGIELVKASADAQVEGAG